MHDIPPPFRRTSNTGVGTTHSAGGRKLCDSHKREANVERQGRKGGVTDPTGPCRASVLCENESAAPILAFFFFSFRLGPCRCVGSPRDTPHDGYRYASALRARRTAAEGPPLECGGRARRKDGRSISPFSRNVSLHKAFFRTGSFLLFLFFCCADGEMDGRSSLFSRIVEDDDEREEKGGERSRGGTGRRRSGDEGGGGGEGESAAHRSPPPPAV